MSRLRRFLSRLRAVFLRLQERKQTKTEPVTEVKTMSTWRPLENLPRPWSNSSGRLSGYWIIAFKAGTTTRQDMAIDYSGNGQTAKFEINSEGYAITSGNVVTNIFVDKPVKIAIVPTEAEADASDLSNAIWPTIDNVRGINTGNELIFETVADMVADTSLAVGDHVRTLGYWSIGDGGGNEYDVVAAGTGTHEGGIYIDLATHQALGLFPNGKNSNQWGAIANGSTDRSTEFQNAIDGAANDTLRVPAASSSIILAGVITASSPVTIEAHGAILEWSTDAANQGFKATSSNVKIFGGDWKGPGFSSFTSTQLGVWFEGTNPSTYITGNELKDANVYNWGGENVRLRMCQYFDVSNNYVYDGRLAGINVLSGLDGVVSNNRVKNFDGDATPECYGIALTKNDGAIATWPQTKRVSVTGNVVSNIEAWTGIDSHGGLDCVIDDNIVYDCKLGIVVTRFDDSTNQYAPIGFSICNNVIHNENIAKTTVANGIQIVGYSDSVYADNIVCVGNVIINHGLESGAIGANNFSAGVYISRYGNVTFSNNIIENSGTHGIFCDLMTGNLNGSSNTIKTLTDSTAGTALYFDGDGDPATGRLEGTVIDVAGYTGVYCETQTELDLINTQFVNASTNFAQTGGTIACEYLKRVDPVYVGSATWNPASIAAGSSSSTTFSSIPGCSSECVVADIGFNRDLQGMVAHFVTGDTDTSTGDFDLYLYNNTSGAIDLDSLTIPYKIIKPL